MRTLTLLGTAVLAGGACLDPLSDAISVTGYGVCCLDSRVTTCSCPPSGACGFGFVACAAGECVNAGVCGAEDAGPPSPDAGTISWDAAFAHDSGAIGPDAGAFEPDAGTFGPDAGTFEPDAGSLGPDASAGRDAGSFPPDASQAPDASPQFGYAACCVGGQVNTCLCPNSVCDPLTPCENGTCVLGANVSCP